MTRPNASPRRLAAGLIAALMIAAPLSAAAQAPTPPKAATIYLVEQMVSPTLPPELIEKIKPMHTLREVEDLLKANSLPFSWRKAELDSSTAPAELITQIEGLPPGEVFVIPQGAAMTYNVIIGRRPKPAT